MFFKKFKNQWDYFLITLIFALIYCSISLANHYLFRTYAWDLGIYTNALYDYARFQWNDSSLFREEPENLLFDHFDFYLIIFSPLSYLFGSYTLLIIQILAILFGGYGIYQYFSDENKEFRLNRLALMSFYSFFGIYTALSFDYHSNVVATMFIPWFFYFIKKQNTTNAFFAMIFIWVGKESMPLIMSFVCLGLMLFPENYQNKKIRNFLIFSLILSFIYFYMVTSVFMPYFANSKTNFQFNKYSHLGNNLFEIIKNVILNPHKIFEYLFINILNNPDADYLKLEFHIFTFISGLWLLFFNYRFLIMLIPIYFMKFFSNHFFMWSAYFNYAVDLAPILIIGSFSVISQFISNHSVQKILSFLIILGNIIATIRLIDAPTFRTGKAMKFYSIRHYQKDYDYKKVYEAMRLIPDDAIVSAQTCFVPHLALRDKIYQFPTIKDAKYILISENEITYPISKEELMNKINEFKNSSNYEILFSKEGVYLFKVKSN